MIVKTEKWYGDSLYTFYTKEDVLLTIQEDCSFEPISKLITTMTLVSKAVLIDGDVYKLRPTTPESLLDNYFKVN